MVAKRDKIICRDANKHKHTYKHIYTHTNVHTRISTHTRAHTRMGTVGQNQGAQYLNWINPWKWANLWAKYWLNCNYRSPLSYKKGLNIDWSNSYIQALPSSVPVGKSSQTELAFVLFSDYYQPHRPTHSPPLRKVEIQLEKDNKWAVDSWLVVGTVILGNLGLG